MKNILLKNFKKRKKNLDFINYPNPNENKIIKGIFCHYVYTFIEYLEEFGY